MHIGIAGNIGCGKTTLTRMLSEHYGWTPKYEAVTYNPYLEDYYKDIQRWSYNLETYFLAQRFQDLLEISLGMCGPVNSILGTDPDVIINRMVKRDMSPNIAS